MSLISAHGGKIITLVKSIIRPKWHAWQNWLNHTQTATFRFVYFTWWWFNRRSRRKASLSLSNQLRYPNDKRLIERHFKWERKRYHRFQKQTGSKRKYWKPLEFAMLKPVYLKQSNNGKVKLGFPVNEHIMSVDEQKKI